MTNKTDETMVPMFQNRLLSSYDHVEEKHNRRIHLNFLDVDPSLDVQIAYVKKNTASHTVGAHIHEDTIEVVYVLRGTQNYRVNEKSYHVHGGELFLSPPKLIHTTDGMPEQKGEFYYLNIPVSCIVSILPPSEQETAREMTRLLLQPPAIYGRFDTNRLRAIMESLFRFHDSDIPYRTLRIRAGLYELLLLTVDTILSSQSANAQQPFEADVFCYIDDHIREKITVDDLAAHFLYSKTAFRNKFLKCAHMPVHEYILRRKIEQAKLLLQNPSVDPRRVWEDLSFSSASYFNEVFKRFTGMTVSQYRQQK